MVGTPRILYIVGTGHSGTTLLNLLLGTAPDTVALGEVKYASWLIPGSRFMGREHEVAQLRCDCGEPPSSCSLWGPVLAGLTPTHDGELDDLELFARVARETGARCVVDSSKSIWRLLRLLAAGHDVKVIHMLRDPRGIAAGHLRRKHRHWLSVGLRWLSTNTFIDARLRASGADVVRLRYDDLARDPRGTLARLNERWELEVPLDDPTAAVNATTFHNFSGNAMRHGPLQGIRPDDAWRRELPVVPRVVLSGLSVLPLHSVWRKQQG